MESPDSQVLPIPPVDMQLPTMLEMSFQSPADLSHVLTFTVLISIPETSWMICLEMDPLTILKPSEAGPCLIC